MVLKYKRITLSLLLPFALTGIASAQSARTAVVVSPPAVNTSTVNAPAVTPPAVTSPMAVADLDGDGLADLVFCDVDGDNLTDVLTLSSSRTRHDTVKNTINNIRARTAPELDVGDLDGDGRPELAILGTATTTTATTTTTTAARASQDSRRAVLSVIRRELGSQSVLGVEALVTRGWLAPGASGGNPLAHIIPTCPTSSPVPPMPYPDPENPGTGGGNTGGSGGGTTVGGGIPSSNGDDAGVGRGVISIRPGSPG